MSADVDPEKWFAAGAHDLAFEYARHALTARPNGPYAGATYPELAERMGETDPLPDEGESLASAVRKARPLVADSVDVTDPACIAHLQCPPIAPAVAADAIAAATNQSLDSFDQAPAATALEERLVEALCETFGYTDGDGVFTSGGTESNLQGLLFARDHALEARGHDPEAGLPPAAREFRILCSSEAHFTAGQAARVLGLGEESVVEVPTDDAGRMDPDALDATLDGLDGDPIALVATAGTTDFGAIDPLAELADRAESQDLWFHVDAAYGGALAFSEPHADRLDGIERADSLALDFHKLLFQPLSCGVFLARESDSFETLARDVAYLDPEGATPPNLVVKSLRTSRGFDALKPYLTFQALGREGVAAFIEAVIDLAEAAAERVAEAPDFELAREPNLSTVVFRYTAADDSDAINERVREELRADGEAVLARTEVDGEVYLKVTLLNPRTTLEDVDGVLSAIRERADAEREVAA